jgi:sugar-specific transcriptional regulator TrmB
MNLDQIIENVLNEKAVNPINQAIVDRIELKLTNKLEETQQILAQLKKVDTRHSLSLLIDDIDNIGQDLVRLGRSAKDYIKTNKPIQSVSY